MKPIGVIGAGSFGTAIADLLSKNSDVLLFSRRQEVIDAVNNGKVHYDVQFNRRVRAVGDLKEIADSCDLILPIIPSSAFRRTIVAIAPYLRPYHFIIHGTKGFDTQNILESDFVKGLSRLNVHTMSEVILQETSVVRIGCLAGPNLAKEIVQGQPTASVISSPFQEVFTLGKKVLDSERFHVFYNNDIIGTETAGALKNIIALGSGIISGMGMGKNLQAMLITRGLVEMITFGKALGAGNEAFLGTAGIGDLIATATSSDSRNYSVGFRIAKGESVEQINASMVETAEGLRTLKIARQLARHYKLKVPITEIIYKVIYEGMDPRKALEYLITFPYDVDVDFI
ncbi:MAG: NAD(P)H-dependent glycerol-3-phosphate dehydrogenase [Saprospiraceae bacterium]